MYTLEQHLNKGHKEAHFPYNIIVAFPRYNKGGKDYKRRENGTIKKIKGFEDREYRFALVPVNTSEGIKKATSHLAEVVQFAADEDAVLSFISTLGGNWVEGDESFYRFKSFTGMNFDSAIIDKHLGNGIMYLDSDTLLRPDSDDLTAPYSEHMLLRDAQSVLAKYKDETGVEVSNYVIHASSSAGMGREIKLHIFWLSEQFMHRSDMHKRSKANTAALNSLDKEPVSDDAVYSKGRKIFVRTPGFTNMADPVETRIVVVTGEGSNDPLHLNPLDPVLVGAGILEDTSRVKKTRKAASRLYSQITSSNKSRSLEGLPPILPISKLTAEEGADRLLNSPLLNHNVALSVLKQNVERHGWGEVELSSKEYLDIWCNAYFQKHYRASTDLTMDHVQQDQGAAFRSTLEKIEEGEYIPFGAKPQVLFNAILKQQTSKVEMPSVDLNIRWANRDLDVITLGEGEFISDRESYESNSYKIVIGGTGTGKTFYLVNEVVAYVKDMVLKGLDPKVLVQIARRALATHTVSTLNKGLSAANLPHRFVSYLKDEKVVRDGGELDKDQLLVISTQSLHKLDTSAITGHSNLFYVKEEINETTHALVTKTVQGETYSIRVVEKAIAKSATHFLGLDASLKTNQWKQLLKDFDADPEDIDVHAYRQHPTSRRLSQRGWNFHKHMSTLTQRFFQEVHLAADCGVLTKKFAATHTSATSATAHKEALILQGIDPSQIILATKKTIADLNLDFAHNNEPGIFIYSPVIAAGFDAKGVYDQHFVFAPKHTNGELSSDAVEQQIGRIRHCKSVRQMYVGEGSHRLKNVDASLEDILTALELGEVLGEGFAAKEAAKGDIVWDNKITLSNINIVKEMLILERSFDLTEQNILMQLTATFQAQGVGVTFEPSEEVDPDLEKDLRAGSAIAKDKYILAVMAATPMTERAAQQVVNTAPQSEMSTTAAAQEKARLIETFGVHGVNFIQADTHGKVTSALDTFVKVATAIVGDEYRLQELERNAAATGTLLIEGSNLRAYYNQLSTLISLSGFNVNVIKKAYKSALSKDEGTTAKRVLTSRLMGLRKRRRDSVTQGSSHLKPTCTPLELEGELLLDIPTEKSPKIDLNASEEELCMQIDSAIFISDAALAVWSFLQSNPRMMRLMSRSVQKGPEDSFNAYVEKVAEGKKARYVPWILLVQRKLASILTGMKLNKVQGLSGETVGWKLKAPHFVVSTHRGFRRLYGRALLPASVHVTTLKKLSSPEAVQVLEKALELKRIGFRVIVPDDVEGTIQAVMDRFKEDPTLPEKRAKERAKSISGNGNFLANFMTLADKYLLN